MCEIIVSMLRKLGLSKVILELGTMNDLVPDTQVTPHDFYPS